MPASLVPEGGVGGGAVYIFVPLSLFSEERRGWEKIGATAFLPSVNGATPAAYLAASLSLTHSSAPLSCSALHSVEP